ncbi:hypothetical protein BZA77DRAFT_247476, partial [Pyronema omphalodes]
HNYLFIAVRTKIYVYIPIFPYQTLPETPYTVLTSEHLDGRPGFINTQDPHGINSLTIGELGSEEVLVSAHDDGDVCIWYTKNLSRIALRRNVGESAWGVALHRERRLLAVSANTHDITVFELGVEPMVRERKEQSDDEDSRETDRSIKILRGHENNIPNISFLDDASGRWLTATDIDGVVTLWDVYTRRMVESCQLGPRQPSPEPEYNRFYRSFYREPEFIAEDDEEEFPYDLDEATEGAISDTDEPSPPQSPDPVIEPVPQIPALPPGEGPDHYQGYSDTDTDSNDDSFSESYDESDDIPDTDNDGVNVSPHESPSSYSTASSIPSSRPTYAAIAYSATIPYPPPSNDELDPAQPPLSYVFTTTEHNAYLLPTHRLSPTVFCRQFVKILPPNNGQLEMFDRLNMVIHIPELSIIVSATQAGRAGIFRLTRVGEDCVMRLDYVLPRVAQNYARNISQSAPPEQEEGYDIPHAIQWPLLGIAASPIQGKEGIEGRRRWRLMMVYMNGTVLSYELGRERGDDGVYGDGYGVLGGDGFVMV